MSLEKPKTQNAELLHMFIDVPFYPSTWGRFDISAHTGISYPPARIGNLMAHGVRFDHGWREGKNKYGRAYRSRTWTILNDINEATEIYNKINNL